MVALTQHDVVSLPVAIYNYLPQAQTVALQLEPSDWYEALDGATRQVKLGPNEVTSATFQIRARKPGDFALTVQAQGAQLKDAIRRSHLSGPRWP